jgi:hypothetical protein
MAQFTDLGQGIFRAEKTAKNGFQMNMYLVRLADGGLLIQSPTWLGEDTFKRINELGVPKIIFAPNHFHHLGITRYRAQYPSAMVVADKVAIPRLMKQGHQNIRDIDEAKALLPDGLHFLRCEGTKTGEAWVSVPGDGGPTWVTSDTFFNVQKPVPGVMGFALKVLQVVPGPQISRIFRTIGLKDKAVYKAFALSALETEKPKRVLVSHGEPLLLENTRLLTDLINARL